MASEGSSNGATAPWPLTTPSPTLGRLQILRTSDAKPDSIASVSARELQFGASPPYLHGVRLLGPDRNRGSTDLKLRLTGAFVADDFSFVLRLGMSSLKHAYL